MRPDAQERYAGKLRWGFTHGCKAAELEGFILVAATSAGNWDGDDDGNEWVMGFAIHSPLFGHGERTYNLYWDDGKGNGAHIAECATMNEALLRAELENAKLR